MNCTGAEAHLPDFLAGDLEPGLRSEFQAHLESCPACSEEVAALAELWARLKVLPVEKPSPALRAKFYRMLAAEGGRAKPWRLPWGTLAKVAATLLLAGGGFTLGFLARGTGQGTLTARDNPLLGQGRTELRLAGVMLAAQGDPEDTVSAEALLDLLDRDASESVRLAAVDALYLYGRQPKVRQRLVSALPRQTSPRVQMALVDLLGGLREQRAMDALRALLGAPSTTPEVARRVRACLVARPL